MNSTKSPSSGRYETMLMVTTLAWSMSFIWSKVVTNTGMASEMYLFIRYSLAGIILFPFAFKYLKTMNKKFVTIEKKSILSKISK